MDKEKEPGVTDEMVQHHMDRIERHIADVQGNVSKLIDRNKNPNFNFPLMMAQSQALTHDADKDLGGENWDGYVLIDWMYKEKKNGRDFPYTASMKAATRRHCSSNSHHPEWYDKRYETNFELFDTDKNRDGASGTPVKATAMRLSDVAEMVCDWKAVADERGNSAWAWYRTAVPHRFLFSAIQTEFIEAMLELLEGPEIPSGKMEEDADLPPEPPAVEISAPAPSKANLVGLRAGKEPDASWHRPSNHKPVQPKPEHEPPKPHVYNPDVECPVDLNAKSPPEEPDKKPNQNANQGTFCRDDKIQKYPDGKGGWRDAKGRQVKPPR